MPAGSHRPQPRSLLCQVNTPVQFNARAPVHGKNILANLRVVVESEDRQPAIKPEMNYGTCRYEQMCGVQVHRLRGGLPGGLLLRIGQSIGHSRRGLH